MAVKSLRMDLSSLILLRLMTMARVAMGDVIPDLGIDWDMMLVGSCVVWRLVLAVS